MPVMRRPSVPNFGVSPSTNDHCQLCSSPDTGSNYQPGSYLVRKQDIGGSESGWRDVSGAETVSEAIGKLCLWKRVLYRHSHPARWDHNELKFVVPQKYRLGYVWDPKRCRWPRSWMDACYPMGLILLAKPGGQCHLSYMNLWALLEVQG